MACASLPSSRSRKAHPVGWMSFAAFLAAGESGGQSWDSFSSCCGGHSRRVDGDECVGQPTRSFPTACICVSVYCFHSHPEKPTRSPQRLVLCFLPVFLVCVCVYVYEENIHIYTHGHQFLTEHSVVSFACRLKIRPKCDLEWLCKNTLMAGAASAPGCHGSCGREVLAPA